MCSRQADEVDAQDALRAAHTAAGVDLVEIITEMSSCTPPGKLPPCTSIQKCSSDSADVWGCYQNNLFMQEQPVDEPQPPGPPEPGEQLNLIQGTCVS